MNTEVFKDIPNYEGLYQVSNLGRVKSLKCGKEKIMKISINGKKYYNIGLRKDKKQITKEVHQLVAMAFLNHKPDGTQKLVVDHKNDIKTDNRLDNLHIVTQRENSTKSKKGISEYTGVHFRKDINKWRAQITINKKIISLGSFTNEYDAHLAYQKKLNEITT